MGSLNSFFEDFEKEAEENLAKERLIKKNKAEVEKPVEDKIDVKEGNVNKESKQVAKPGLAIKINSNNFKSEPCKNKNVERPEIKKKSGGIRIKPKVKHESEKHHDKNNSSLKVSYEQRPVENKKPILNDMGREIVVKNSKSYSEENKVDVVQDIINHNPRLQHNNEDRGSSIEKKKEWKPFNPKDNRKYTKEDLGNPLYSSEETRFVKSIIEKNELEGQLEQELAKGIQKDEQVDENLAERLFNRSDTPLAYKKMWMDLYNKAKNSDKKGVFQKKISNGKFRIDENGTKEILPDMETHGITSSDLLNMEWKVL